MKKRTKALIGILTATSLTVAAVSMMFIHNHEADAKNASFNGIGSIIKKLYRGESFYCSGAGS